MSASAAARSSVIGSSSREMERELTLLVTDLARFTEQVEALGDEAALELLRIHNRILRRCIASHCGYEIDHTGDGMIAAFAAPVDALRCAVDMQRKLRTFNDSRPSQPLRLRVGLHSGRVLPEEGRLFGRGVIFAVRVCAAARAGTVLLSQAVAELAGPEFRCRSRGSFVLKGIREPQVLHELRWTRRGSHLTDEKMCP